MGIYKNILRMKTLVILALLATATFAAHKRRDGFLDAAKNAAISLGKSALSGAINSAAGTATSMLARRRAGFLDAAKNAAISLGKSALSGAINSAAGTATSMLANRRAL